MDEQVIGRLPMTFAHTTPINYQNVPPLQVINCQDFPKGCSPHKECDLPCGLGHLDALPRKREA